MTHKLRSFLLLGTASAMILALVLTLLPATAFATGTLDQSQPETSTTYRVVSGPTSFDGGNSEAQTFTAGRSGVLDQVDLNLVGFIPSGPLTVEIRDVGPNGEPGLTVLASSELTGVTEPSWYSVPFASGASVVAGTKYAIVIYTSADGDYGWSLSQSTDPYAAGAAFGGDGSPPSTWAIVSYSDLAFKTYVHAPGADLSLTMVGPDETARKATATYILTVHNTGPDTATHTVLTDNLPYGVHLTAVTTSQGSCTPPSKGVTTVSCDLGDIANGGETNSAVTVKIQVHANANVNFVASVTSDAPDPNQDNNNASFLTRATK
ncbi:MAG: DUF11 domain-containing protein [Nitrolancea sp.]